MAKIGIIGGSGLYDLEGITDVKRIKVDTPFGSPSDELVTGNLSGKEVVFLARHSKGHTKLPSELNFRANIYAMKSMGVERIISASAVGSLKKELHPRDFVIPDQFVDRTTGRIATFFGDGIVAHISFGDPVCPVISDALYKAGKSLKIGIHKGGTYVNMEGPQFSTRAESNLYRSWGMDIIGMTNLAEAKLAREAEICYATLAMVTDYDCWYKGEEEVTLDMILQNLFANVDAAKKLLKEVIVKMPEERNCICKSALKDAIVTNPELIKKETKEKLKLIIGKYIK